MVPWSPMARNSQHFKKAVCLHRLFIRLNRTMIIIKPQNRSAFLEKYDRPSTTLYPHMSFLYQVWGTSVRWSILDLTRAWECDVALEQYCSIPTSCKTLVNWKIIIAAITNAHQLRVTKNRYIDCGIIRNATCHLTWVFIWVFKSFLRGENWRKCQILMQWHNMRICLQLSFHILNV